MCQIIWICMEEKMRYEIHGSLFMRFFIFFSWFELSFPVKYWNGVFESLWRMAKESKRIIDLTAANQKLRLDVFINTLSQNMFNDDFSFEKSVCIGSTIMKSN